MSPRWSTGRRLLSPLLIATLLLPTSAGTALAVEADGVTGDITKPALVSLSVEPGTVDVTDTAATLTVTARLTDGGSGVDVDRSSFGWVSSSGTLHTSAFFTRVSGDEHDGTYTTTMTVPAGAPAGAWPLSVAVQDRVGNAVLLRRAELSSAGLPGHVDVIDRDPDLTAAQVVDVQLAATSVDVLAGPASIGLRLRLVDDKSGATMPYVVPRSPHQRGPGGIRPPLLTLVEGTPGDGWWEGRIEVPRYAHSGSWSLDIRTYDRLLNVSELTAEQLAERGLPTRFDVVSEQDVTPPAITAATISSLELDVSDGDREVRLGATMVDDLSGIEESHGTPYLSFAMHHPIGQWQGSPRIERLSGSALDGTYAATLTIPRSSATGLWPLHLGVMDAIGNSHSLTPVELAQLGLPPAVLVYNTPLPPLDVTVDPADAAAVVGWEPPADERGAEVVEYLVRELPDGKLVRADASARQAVVPGLTNDVAHRFTVYAVNRAGESDPSTTVTAQPSAALPPPPTSAPGEPAVQRLAGRDRVETAIAVSRSAWSSGAAGAAVLTRADDYADALAGTPLAAKHSAPLLLTAGAALDGRVRTELARVLPTGRTVFVLGGERAVGPAVVQSLREAGYVVQRVAGSDRYSTSTAVARQVTANPQAVLLATGRAFADALGAGVAAASVGGVVLLTDGARMPAATSAYLSQHSAPRFAVGGPASAADPGARPIVGLDRYETALLTSQRFPAREKRVGAATGEDFADALSGGAHAARTGGSLLLTPRLALPQAVSDHLSRTGVREAVVYGGPAVVDARVLTRLASIVGG